MGSRRFPSAAAAGSERVFAAASRGDCLAISGAAVKEGKVCTAGTCDPGTGPNKPLTWWEQCPSNEPCPGPTLGNMDGVIGCVDSIADDLVGDLLCLQFPNASACPTATPTPGVPTPTPTSTP